MFQAKFATTLMIVTTLIHFMHCQTPCNEFNGLCSDQCLYYTGAADVSCGCPCLTQLDPADNRTCVDAPGTTVQCRLEFYVLIDVSALTDPVDCAASSGQSWNRWKNWRDNVVAVLEFIDEFTDRSVAVETYSTTVTTLQDYTYSMDLSDVKNTLNGMARPNCTSSSSDVILPFLTPLRSASGRLTGTMDSANASRVAVVLTSGNNQSMTFDEIEDARENELLQNFDDIIIFTRKPETNDSITVDASVNNEWIVRAVSCGHDTNVTQQEACLSVFYVDSTNDGNALPISINFHNSYDKKSCYARNAVQAEVTSCAGSIHVALPKCQLRGMTLDNLQLLNTSCLLSDFEVGSTSTQYKLQLPFVGCGTQTLVVDAENGTRGFTQHITTRSFGASDFLVEIDLEVSCTLPAFATATAPTIRPLTDLRHTQQHASGSYIVTLSLFSDAGLSSPLSQTVTVNDPVYVRAESNLADGLTLRLDEVIATSDTSRSSNPSHMIAQSGCGVDTTYQLLTSTDPAVLIFKFDMFQFVDTFHPSLQSKLPVYFHASFFACTDDDVTPLCSVSCSARRRRDVNADDDDVITSQRLFAKTIGPFVATTKHGQTDENAADVYQQFPTFSRDERIPKETSHDFTSWLNYNRLSTALRRKINHLKTFGFSNTNNILFMLALVVLIWSCTSWTGKERRAPLIFHEANNGCCSKRALISSSIAPSDCGEFSRISSDEPPPAYIE